MAQGQQVASVWVDIGAKVDNFTKGAGDVISGMGKIAFSATMLTSAMKVLESAFDLAQEGAKLQRLADAGAEVARQYGGNMDLIIRKVKEASLGAVSEMDIIASANKAMMLGLGSDAEQLANLMEIAAFRGRAMGVSTTQAFDDIVRGIGRASPLILDNLGIVVKLGEVNEKYAKSIGKTVQELTAAEKKQALLNAVLDEGNSLLAEAGGLVEDNASAYEKLQTQMKDNQDRAKMLASDGISPLVSYLADSTEQMNKNAAALQVMDEELYKNYMAHKVLTPEMQALIAGAERGKAMMEFYGVSVAGASESTEDFAEATQEATDANKDMLSLVGDMQSEFESYNEKYQEITEDQNLSDDERKVKLQELADEHEQYTRRVVLGLLEQKLMQDGILTDDELNWLLEKGEAWGIYSATVIEESKKAMDEANNLATALSNMPKTGTFSFFINAIGDLEGVSRMSSNAPQIEQRRASGGQVWAGNSYLVGEQGMEVFTPNQNGMITPNSRLNSMGGGQTDPRIITLLEEIANKPTVNEYQLARIITESTLQEKR